MLKFGVLDLCGAFLLADKPMLAQPDPKNAKLTSDSWLLAELNFMLSQPSPKADIGGFPSR